MFSLFMFCLLTSVNSRHIFLMHLAFYISVKWQEKQVKTINDNQVQMVTYSIQSSMCSLVAGNR
jgi:hypothetical protein